MKKRNLILGLALAAALLSAGCGKEEPPAVYSNLTEETIRYDLDSLLKTAGVGDAARAQLFAHADQINRVITKDQLTDGFTPLGDPKYDPYQVQEQWMAEYPDFLGYNCRITAFSLFGENFLSLPEDERPSSTEMLQFDIEALNEDPSAFPGRERQFLDFYAIIPTEPSKDIKVHAEKVQNAWKDRGITFREDPNIRMINMYFHAQEGDRDYLYAGHAGILLPTPDGDFWFLEKLAFEEPYQLTRFAGRNQLQNYLMEKYDLDWGQPTAKPFLMENDSLMKN